jgi:hypothetical protein
MRNLIGEYFSETPPPPPQQPIPWLVPADATGATAAQSGRSSPAFVTLDTVRRELISLRSPWSPAASVSSACSQPVREGECQRAVECSSHAPPTRVCNIVGIDTSARRQSVLGESMAFQWGCLHLDVSMTF